MRPTSELVICSLPSGVCAVNARPEKLSWNFFALMSADCSIAVSDAGFRDAFEARAVFVVGVQHRNFGRAGAGTFEEACASQRNNLQTFL